jgi:four helix bundle protein
MRERTRRFALGIIRLVEALPRNRTCDVIGKQLIRCGTSVGGNYRSACRARSSADFISKMCIVEEEADETVYWQELLVDAGYLPAEEAAPFIKEANEVVAICVTSIKTARGGSR